MNENKIESTTSTCGLSREQFEFLLTGIESNYALAFESAKGIDIYKSDARTLARQRRMNQMVENGIIQLEEMSNITVAVSREETIGKVPFPPRVNHQITMLNYDNQR